MSNNKENDGTDSQMFQVFVDDNFHFMDEDERYMAGEFANYEDALTEAQRIVDRDLAHMVEPGMTADQLYKQYTNFGEDPFILPANMDDRFSAWDYAEAQCSKIIIGAKMALN